ncbi:dehydrogenase [Bdellovibrio bacteriovorus]|uniref:Dehydrogenase n=1 Tax=Bdellovibrio bacteriovorus TaxID=959 RepID=A0A150WNU6_BDEBC|nr:dehydrogenase [Bdellovibrio bacteriovorus]KYG66036.1 dehydrogenase [Bdellovibrio bacteriovorus]
MKSSYRIAEISFGRPSWDTAYEFEFEGKNFEVQRFGTNFSVEAFQKLIESLRSQVDAFALTSLPPVIRLDQKSYVHRQYLDIMGTPSPVPLCDGTGLREVSNITSLIQKMESGEIDPERGIFFPAAMFSTELEEYIRARYPKSIYFGDAYSLLGIPILLQPFKGLKTLSKLALNVANLKDLRSNTPLAETKLQKLSRSSLAAQVENVQYVFCDLPFLLLFDSSTEFVRGKDLVIWSCHPKMEEEARKFSPRSITNLIPEKYRIHPCMNYSVLDATLRLARGRTAPLSIEEWEQVLAQDVDIRHVARKYVMSRQASTQAKISKSVNTLKNKILNQKEPDFAFVVHALSHDDFLRVPGLSLLKHMPKEWNNRFDRVASNAPAFVWGHVKHIMSKETGQEINGIIYTLPATPKVLKESDPEEIYQKIQGLCYDAANRGAKMIGLGAYTKIVGDQGITINQNSPIPVTTGNSLSAAATLWALRDVVIKMNLLKISPESGLVDGMAMVVGATGSIGQVSAKLLSMVFNRLTLVAPRMNRLLELRAEIEKISPNCKVIVSTDANELAGEADAVVTATSAFDHKIIDVMRLKPGAVVCDCSRPLDFDKDDAKKRPDVLIIESGEVVLPGPVELTCDLGLPGKTVYACLAETALLTMEKRYEPFTMGRDIEWDKVKQIYKMARRHGVELAAIQGHMGIITDREIELTRQLALSKRKK